MKAPHPENLAQHLAKDRPQLAVDVLRAVGYTRRAAKRLVQQHERGVAPLQRNDPDE